MDDRKNTVTVGYQTKQNMIREGTWEQEIYKGTVRLDLQKPNVKGPSNYRAMLC